jgi:hypothetical protein
MVHDGGLPIASFAISQALGSGFGA